MVGPQRLSGEDIETRSADTSLLQRRDERLFVDDERRLSPEERLRRRRHRASVLDLVMGDAKRLSGRLGLSDRRKVDEYMTQN